MRPPIWFLGWLCCASGFGQDRIFLAYEESGRTGCVFLGWFERDGFVRTPEMQSQEPDGIFDAARRVLKGLPIRKKLFGVDRLGRVSTAHVLETNPAPLLGEHAIDLARDRLGVIEPVLLSTAPLPIEILRPHGAKLTQKIEADIAVEADRLWAKALTEKTPGDPTDTYHLHVPDVWQVGQAPEILAIYYPTLIQYEGNDFGDSGSMFFLYSLAENRIVFSTFGHPEWSNGATTTIVKPDIFFRVKGGKAVYFVGSHIGGWEEWGNAIYDLRTGRLVLFCY